MRIRSHNPSHDPLINADTSRIFVDNGGVVVFRRVWGMMKPEQWEQLLREQNHKQREEQLERLLRRVEKWNEWRRENEGVKINLIQANLSRADLRYADLSEAYLSRADLSEAYLNYADLSEANLRNANLRNANLRDANLRNANLRNANLRNANLYHANLSEVYLRHADLRGACLINTNLRNANLRDANLRGAYLKGADFRDADLLNTKGINRTLLEETFRIRIFDSEIAPSSLEELNDAISNYAEMAGYVEPEILWEEYGSFFSNIRFKVAKLLTPNVKEEAVREGEELYRRSKENIKAKLENPSVESTQKIVTATAQLLKAIENFDNIVLTLGKLVAVKYTDENGKTQTIVRTVSTEIQNKLESTPHLLNDPKAFVRLLQESSKEKKFEAKMIVQNQALPPS